MYELLLKTKKNQVQSSGASTSQRQDDEPSRENLIRNITTRCRTIPQSIHPFRVPVPLN